MSPQAARQLARQAAPRAALAAAVSAVGTPCVLLGQLLVGGRPAGAATTLLAALAAAAVGALAPRGVLARRAGALVAVVGLAQLAAQVVLSAAPGDAGPASCLPVVGRGAELGVRFAVLRADTGCPSGSYVAGPTAAVVLAALGLAVAVLVGHALGALVGGLLLGAVAAAGHLAAVALEIAARLRSLASLVRTMLHAAAAAVRRVPSATPAAWRAHRPARSVWAARPPVRRGPPVRSAARAHA